MNIAIVSNSDIGGGAAISAYRLHKGLQSIGHNSTMRVRQKYSKDVTVHSIQPRARILAYARNLSNRLMQFPTKRYQLGRNCDVFSIPRSSYRIPDLAQTHFDIINLHWVTRLLDQPAFFSRISELPPVVWTLHDMNAFTGGCHYDGGCGRYSESCGTCPELQSHDQQDLSSKIFHLKLASFQGIQPHQLTIVTPSKWLQRCVERSTLLNRFECVHIPYGIETGVFAPRSKSHAKASFGIDENSLTVLFVAAKTTNHRKGFDLLKEALCQLSYPDKLVCLCVGEETPPDLPANIRVICTGKLSAATDLAKAYNAADVMVIPSRQDNLPNTVLESISSGTPVVGFRTGGIPDMVRDGITGYACESNDSAQLAKSLHQILREISSGRDFSRQCREVALSEYGLDLQAQRYSTLFSEKINLSRRFRVATQ